MNIKNVLGILYLISLFSTPGSAVIHTITKLEHVSGRKIKIFHDNHAMCSDVKNEEQLKSFLRLLANDYKQKPLHLIIESKFFYGCEWGSDNFDLDSCLEKMNDFLNISVEWTYSFSPQDETMTTWIAWHFPYLLWAIKTKESQVPIDVPEDFKKVVHNNLNVDFLDPRLGIPDHEEIDLIIENYRGAIAALSQNQNASTSSNTLSDQLEGESVSIDHLFDLQSITAIANADSEREIIILCGGWHANNIIRQLFLIDPDWQGAENPGKAKALPPK